MERRRDELVDEAQRAAAGIELDAQFARPSGSDAGDAVARRGVAVPFRIAGAQTLT